MELFLQLQKSLLLHLAKLTASDDTYVTSDEITITVTESSSEEEEEESSSEGSSSSPLAISFPTTSRASSVAAGETSYYTFTYTGSENWTLTIPNRTDLSILVFAGDSVPSDWSIIGCLWYPSGFSGFDENGIANPFYSTTSDTYYISVSNDGSFTKNFDLSVGY